MRTELLTPSVVAVPGEPFFVRVEVVNNVDVIDEVVLAAPGLDDAWISGEDRRAALFPDSKVELMACIELPEHYPAGEHEIVLDVRSSASPEAATNETVRVEMAATSRAELRLRPALITAGRRAVFRAIVSNESNQELALTIAARDSLRALTFDVQPPHLRIGAGADAEAVIVAHGRRPWFGSPLTRTITIEADGAEQELIGAATFNQKARIPRGALTALTLAFILALWAAAFTVGVNQVLAGEALGKQTPQLFPLAHSDLDVEAVSGSISGKVLAGTNGASLERITVEAYRNGRDGPEIAASAATTEDGTFELVGLLPGNYLLRATAPGFRETWAGGQPSAGSAEPTKVEASTETGDIELLIEGNAGSISGTILINAVDGADSFAEVRLIAVRDGVRGAEIGSVVTDADGFFVLPDVPSPADYELVISSVGFDDRTVPISVEGGEDLVANTIRLSAGPGEIGGLVTSDLGPLGGVTVTVSDGAFLVETLTPTSGEIGTYVVADLPTPATYLITFSLDGHEVETIALDLGPGETRTDVDAEMVGGTGDVSGKIVDQAGQPLGGVDVTVSGGTVRATTQSLTSGDIGSWRVLDLTTPGRYTVTFELDGYSQETRAVDLDASRGLDGLDVTLFRTVGSLSGTVSSAGTPLGGIEVEVSNGSVSQTTASATSPAGAWLVNGLTPGAYTVTFSGDGYEDQTVLVTLGSGQDVDVDVDLLSAQ